MRTHVTYPLGFLFYLLTRPKLQKTEHQARHLHRSNFVILKIE
jgi:hypothetical protein